MRLFIYIIIIGFIIAGLIIPSDQLVMAGAILFMAMQLFDLIIVYIEARQYKAGKWKPKEKTVINKITK